MNTTDLLAPLRSRAGTVRTTGLDDATVNRLSERFPELREAAQAAVDAFAGIQAEFPELVDADETDIDLVVINGIPRAGRPGFIGIGRRVSATSCFDVSSRQTSG